MKNIIINNYYPLNFKFENINIVVKAENPLKKVKKFLKVIRKFSYCVLQLKVSFL